MARENLTDLAAFLAVARDRSFTRAAAKLGISQSALSQTIRALEERLGIRLLTRSTRSVAPTVAGDRLVDTIGAHVDGIHAALAHLNEFRATPAGLIRITADEYAAHDVLWPIIDRFLPAYPDIKIEIVIDYKLTDIVAEQFDAGVRAEETVAKDMFAVPIGPDLRMVVVGSPTYLANHPAPRRPQDLTAHRCINLRLPTRGGLYAWELEKRGRKVNVRVDGPLVLSSGGLILKAALGGHGLAYMAQGQVQPHVDRGELRLVLEDWCPTYPGYHLYYPTRRQPTPAFAAFLSAIRDGKRA